MNNRLRGIALTLAVAPAMAACGLLEVDNPNALVEEDIRKREAAVAAVNGSLATVTRGVGSIYAPFSTVGDEITWIGSRDAWNELDKGTPDNVGNEFTDGAFPSIAQGRWMADFAIEIVQGHAAEAPGNAGFADLLARANLYSGIAYSTIGQMFDDFSLSNRTEAAPLVGPENMSSMFDQAISYFTAAMSGSDDVPMQAQAARAQAHHQKAIWNLLNPAGSAPANPLINDSNASGDAAAVLASLGGEDWAHRLSYSAASVSNSLAFQVNEREELQIGPEYATQDPEDNTSLTGHVLMDPIEMAVDTRYKMRVDEFLGAAAYAPITFSGARGMHLILAEAALASGDMSGFTMHINHIREDMDGLTPYSDQIEAMDILQHERRVNLFLQFKRLQDHYRFGVTSMNWLPGSKAATAPGTMLPITISEIRANCHHPDYDGPPCSN